MLQALPDDSGALLLLARALRHQRDFKGAKDILEDLVKREPDSADVLMELGSTLGDMGEHQRAIAVLTAAVNLDRNCIEAWHVLGEQYLIIGETFASDAAFGHHFNLAIKDPQLQRAVTALKNGRADVAEDLLVEYLENNPEDVSALKMMAEVALTQERLHDAETLLAQCLELDPEFAAARFRRAATLLQINGVEEALAEMDRLLAVDPGNPQFRCLRGNILSQLGRSEEAYACFESLISEFPRQAAAWIQYAHCSKSTGKLDQAIHAYRKAIELVPDMGGAYWSLANLKTFRFTDQDNAEMERQLARPEVTVESRVQFHFALGKAYEDLERYEESFQNYRKGSALWRSTVTYDQEETREFGLATKTIFTREFFEERAGWGYPARDPIFVVGMPRAGSTLLEQILSSHSQIEGTMELPHVTTYSRRLNDRDSEGELKYPEILQEVHAKEFRDFGEEYIRMTRTQRHTDRPFFVDKMPNNFLHIPLIHLILPNAKIIDARRHPMACGFSNFKQHFARGQHFTYTLHDMGSYYRNYVDMMAHFDKVLPGKIHRVIYEKMVDDPETEIRRLLEYLGLPFEEQCLRFHETKRFVRTASSEQVRTPLYKSAKEHWRNYEPWLGPLKEALGNVLDAYPGVPDEIT